MSIEAQRNVKSALITPIYTGEILTQNGNAQQHAPMNMLTTGKFVKKKNNKER